MIKSLMKIFVNKKMLFDLMVYKIDAKKDIKDVVRTIEKVCDENNFTLLHKYVYHEILESKGLPIQRKVYIYEVCVAKVAALVLTNEPTMAPFMPCRIAVYEENDAVVISTQNMEIMLDSFDSKSNIYKQTSQLYKELKNLMSKIIGKNYGT